MKKLSAFLAAVMMFVMVATAMVTAEDVKAFSYRELDTTGFKEYTSGNAGATIWYRDMIGNGETDVDITGWKFCICPEGNESLAASVCTINLSNENKIQDDWSGTLKWYVEVEGVLSTDLNGSYVGVFFDGNDQKMLGSDPTNFVAKECVRMYFQTIDNSQYVYAYTYAGTESLNADVFPTLYGVDKTTPLTSLDKYMTKVDEEYGDTIHIWRLKVLGGSQVEGYTYYKFNSTASELVPSYMDGNGLGHGYLTNFGQWGANNGVAIVDPFEQNGSGTPNTPPATPVTTNTIAGSGTANASVTGLTTVLPLGTTLADYQLTEGQDYEKSVAAAVANLGTDATYSVFKLDLTDPNGAAMTQLADFVKVSIPVPANLTIPAGKTVAVYRCEENGTLTKCNTNVKDGVVTFETNHFSNYILSVEKTQDASANYIPTGAASTTVQTSPKTGDVATAPIVLAMVSAVGITVVTMKRKFFA